MRSQSNAAEQVPAESGVYFLKIAAVLSGVLLVLYVKSGDTLLVVQQLVLWAAVVLKILNKDVVKIENIPNNCYS
jgi:hypothetical protein